MFHFDLVSLREKAALNDKLSFQEGFWNDSEKAQNIMQETKMLKDKISEYEDMISEIDDIEMLLSLMEDEDDFEDYREVAKSIEKLLEKGEEIGRASCRERV